MLTQLLCLTIKEQNLKSKVKQMNGTRRKCLITSNNQNKRIDNKIFNKYSINNNNKQLKVVINIKNINNKSSSKQYIVNK